MAKPPTRPRSIRLTLEAWTWLEAEAERLGVKVNSLVASYVERARKGLPAGLK